MMFLALLLWFQARVRLPGGSPPSSHGRRWADGSWVRFSPTDRSAPVTLSPSARVAVIAGISSSLPSLPGCHERAAGDAISSGVVSSDDPARRPEWGPTIATPNGPRRRILASRPPSNPARLRHPPFSGCRSGTRRAGGHGRASCRAGGLSTYTVPPSRTSSSKQRAAPVVARNPPRLIQAMQPRAVGCGNRATGAPRVDHDVGRPLI